MCFTSRMLPKESIAKHNIIVYKIINNDNSSIVKHFPYNKNKANKYIYIRFDVMQQYYVANEGYYSYKSIKTALNALLISAMPTKYFISKNIKLSKFIIPKGIKYYTNESNEIISENIIYKSDVSLNKIKLFHYGLYRKIKCNRSNY